MTTNGLEIDLEDFFDQNNELRIEEHEDYWWGYQKQDDDYYYVNTRWPAGDWASHTPVPRDCVIESINKAIGERGIEIIPADEEGIPA